MVKEMASPCAASPPTEPVTATVPAACGVDDVISGDVVNGDGCRSATNGVAEVAVAENELPALSVPVTVASKDVSAARSEPATSMEKLLLESTVPE